METARLQQLKREPARAGIGSKRAHELAPEVLRVVSRSARAGADFTEFYPGLTEKVEFWVPSAA